MLRNYIFTDFKALLVYSFADYIILTKLFNAKRGLRATSYSTVTSGPKVIKLFSCSTELSMKFILLINL